MARPEELSETLAALAERYDDLFKFTSVGDYAADDFAFDQVGSMGLTEATKLFNATIVSETLRTMVDPAGAQLNKPKATFADESMVIAQQGTRTGRNATDTPSFESNVSTMTAVPEAEGAITGPKEVPVMISFGMPAGVQQTLGTTTDEELHYGLKQFLGQLRRDGSRMKQAIQDGDFDPSNAQFYLTKGKGDTINVAAENLDGTGRTLVAAFPLGRPEQVMTTNLQDNVLPG